MNNRVKTKTVNLGRLPVYCGCWNEGIAYHKYNIVTYYGSSFINLVEGNKKFPANIIEDSSGRMMNYSFEYDDGTWTGWMFVANAYDASIYAKEAGDYAKLEGDEARRLVEENFFTMEIDPETGDVWATYYLGGNIETVYCNDPSDSNPEDVDETGRFIYGDLGDIIMIYENSVPRYVLNYIVNHEDADHTSHTDEYGTFRVFVGDPIPVVKDPELSGYTFSGWTGKPEGDIMPNHDVTITGTLTRN